MDERNICEPVMMPLAMNAPPASIPSATLLNRCVVAWICA